MQTLTDQATCTRFQDNFKWPSPETSRYIRTTDIEKNPLAVYRSSESKTRPSGREYNNTVSQAYENTWSLTPSEQYEQNPNFYSLVLSGFCEHDAAMKSRYEFLIFDESLDVSFDFPEDLWTGTFDAKALRTVASQCRNQASNYDLSIQILFRKAEECYFEDGIESEFSRDLMDNIHAGGIDFLNVLEEYLLKETTNPEVVSESLRWIGYIDHQETYNKRKAILIECLKSQSLRIRDGALLGISYLEDKNTLVALSEAIEKEICPSLKNDMEQFKQYLEG